ncbi:tyrosinase family protein [Novosphingobium sp. BL-52-GroH]|uniref:tyrosinase family protein n=1 Tax=Novosphingobium sp. BL-52-GroH TaxID=3349877 RepID=UPI00384E98C4
MTELDQVLPMSRRKALFGAATGAVAIGMVSSAISATPTAPAAVASPTQLPPTKPARWHRLRVDDPATPARVLESYKKGIRAMLALPPSDPRNWYRVVMIHAMDCPHGNWWLLPWHRGFVGMVERIVRDLSGDPYFAFPYWDWSVTPRIPDALFDDVLDPSHPAFLGSFEEFKHKFEKTVAGLPCWKASKKPDGLFDHDTQYGHLLQRGYRFPADFWFDLGESPASKWFFDRNHTRGLTRAKPDFDAIVRKATSRQTVLAALGPNDFESFGSAKGSNHHRGVSKGLLETQPHDFIHGVVGGLMREARPEDGPLGAPMGSGPGGFLQGNMSPTDPIFYLHHTNLDRLWDVWVRKQAAIGGPILPEGYKTESSEGQSNYKTWAKEKFLFFIDEKGAPSKKTTCADYIWPGEFDYDYQPGTAEELVALAPESKIAPQRFAAEVRNPAISTIQAATCTVAVPSGLTQTCSYQAAPASLVANVELDFAHHASGAVLHVFLDPPSDTRELTPSSAHHVGSILCPNMVHSTIAVNLNLNQALRAMRECGRLTETRTLKFRIGTQQALPDLIADKMANSCGDAVCHIADVKAVTLVTA